MDFKSVFLDALISDPKISAGLMPEAFLGQTLPMADEDSLPFFKLLSCGTLKTQFPWSFDIRTLDCFLFLYTKKAAANCCSTDKFTPLILETLFF